MHKNMGKYDDDDFNFRFIIGILFISSGVGYIVYGGDGSSSFSSTVAGIIGILIGIAAILDKEKK
jgi:uncharacterized membrane protein HdeD (DUF308 family)